MRRSFVDGYRDYWWNLRFGASMVVFELGRREWGRAVIAFDRFVWATLFGGSPDVTISWAVGYWMLNSRSAGKVFRWVVDVLMYPIDGWNHVARVAGSKGRPPAGAGGIYPLATLFLIFSAVHTVGAIV